MKGSPSRQINRPDQRGPQGVRQDRFSGSKVSKRTRFQPFYCATEGMYAKYYDRIKNRTVPFIQIDRTHPEFIVPFSEEDIHSALARIPAAFIDGIKAILVPSGSRRQLAALERLHLLGEYWQQCIFLHPYPRRLMKMAFPRTPPPHVVQAYNRAEATIAETRTGIEVSFDEASLKRYYLCDVLMHEIGHHNDHRLRSRPRGERERFATWFASEYGFRLT
jgi:hypothetical protein